MGSNPFVNECMYAFSLNVFSYVGQGFPIKLHPVKIFKGLSISEVDSEFAQVGWPNTQKLK